jgi:hypothetical protein
MTITLETIKAAHDQVADMIAKFEAQRPTVLSIPLAHIELQHGERYAGLIVGDDGKPSHHLILLLGDGESLNWKKAQEWAKAQGGELPNRREQALLYANLKGEFQPAWYWSSERYSAASAWSQGFGYGYQDNYRQNGELRARAVRRLSV